MRKLTENQMESARWALIQGKTVDDAVKASGLSLDAVLAIEEELHSSAIGKERIAHYRAFNGMSPKQEYASHVARRNELKRTVWKGEWL